jgi:hypothetical protein
MENNWIKIRKENYRKLREVGYNSYESNQLKDYSPQKVDYFIQMRKQFEKWKSEYIKEKGKPRNGKE